MMRFVYEPCRPCFGARELPHVILSADEPVVTLILNSPIPYGAHEPSHRYQTATLASIEVGTAIVVPTSLKKAWRWREASTSHTPSGPPVGVDALPNGRTSKFSFCQLLRKGVSHLTSRYNHGMQICKWSRNRKWETCCSKKTTRNSPQAICNPHVECYELSTAWEIWEIPLDTTQASSLESVWSSNMEITINSLP